MSLTAIILAGGKSSRMGQDKAFIPWKGKPFIEHSIAAAEKVASRVILSGDTPRLLEFGLEVIKDVQKGKGPVYALASCFSQVKTENALVLSCDVPQVSASDLEYLIQNHESGVDVTCYAYDGKVMPLVGVYSSSSFDAFKNAVEGEERKLFTVLSRLNVKTIDYKGEGGLMNINNPEDLKALL
jgi:molybdopterin-guanine dinucleotide biosynthesis protein A